MNMFQKIGESPLTRQNADPRGAEIIGVPMEAGNGTIARGTVIYRKASGLWAPAAAANVIAANELAIINEECDTTGDAASETVTVGPDAAAYRAGRFWDGCVKLTEDGEVTDAMKVILRTQGIVFLSGSDAAEFDNGVTAASDDDGE